MAVINISGYDVFIDDEDVERVRSKKWYIRRNDIKYDLYYFVSSVYSENSIHHKYTESLHRFIMKCSAHDGCVVDHANRNTLDNRKCNLRICSHSDNVRNVKRNIRNTSLYKGVVYNKKRSTWMAQINYNNKRIYIGANDDPIKCAKMYDLYAIKMYKEFANLNFPETKYDEQESIIESYKYDMHLSKANKSHYRGVSFNNKKRRYVAQLQIGKQHIFIGYFPTPEEAARAYDRKAKELLGTSARLNFPDEA